MFNKSFTIVYKPVKNNFVIFGDSYLRLISTYTNGCVCLSYDNKKQYFSWQPYAGQVGSNEIGMNGSFAKALGLREGYSVDCILINNVMTLSAIHVTPNSVADWEILSSSQNSVQMSLLDQAKVVSANQNLVIWINRSVHLTIRIDKLSPDLLYGQLCNRTEMLVQPYKTVTERINEMKAATPRIEAPAITTNGVHKSPSTNGVLTSYQSPLTRSSDNTEDVLKKYNSRLFEFRVIPGDMPHEFQTNDIYLTKWNLPKYLDIDKTFLLKTNTDSEYYVNVKLVSDNDFFPKNIYPTVEINAVLMKRLGIKQFQRVTLRPASTLLNDVEVIEIRLNKKSSISTDNPAALREIERQFKQLIRDNTSLYPVLLNQKQLFELPNGDHALLKLLPETLKYCLIDSQIFRKCVVQCSAEKENLDDYLRKSEDKVAGVKNLIELDCFTSIRDDCVETIKSNLCLDEMATICKVTNVILAGSSRCGKSTVINEIITAVSAAPFYCFHAVFQCSKHKGRKVESIAKDLRLMLTECVNNSPSVLILEQLDSLVHAVAENAQDGDYLNRVANAVHCLLQEYTENTPITVIATVVHLTALNSHIYHPRGSYLFQKVIKIADLDKGTRMAIIKHLCGDVRKTDLDYERFGDATEGYYIGNLVDLVERAVFYSHRQNVKSPVLTNDNMAESLKTTNEYCLQGVQNIQQSKGGEFSAAGLEEVVQVLEEILLWPARYPRAFEKAPLRPQKGVLLYGPPGTGKTYLVSQVANLWNIRMIAVKGPELLAKYIGQSEENVRNLFERARNLKPCVLFFDEFDSLAPRRGHDSTGVTDRLVNQLLTELDGVGGLQGVVIIAATSRPDLLDPALLRSGRIDRMVECHLPDAVARLKIFQNLAKTMCLEKAVDLKYFASKTNNFTGADIQNILTTASMLAIKEISAENRALLEKVTVTQEHLLKAFETTRPSLSQQDLVKFAEKYASLHQKEPGKRMQTSKKTSLA